MALNVGIPASLYSYIMWDLSGIWEKEGEINITYVCITMMLPVEYTTSVT
jgi:hypothetical protein